MKKKIAVTLAFVLSLINMAASALFTYFQDVRTVPTHFGPDLKPDAYGSKWALLFIPAVCLLLSVGFYIYRIATAKKENVQKNKKYEDRFIVSFILIFIILGWGLALGTTGIITITADAVVPWITIALGLIMVVLSNIMGKLAPNRTFGLRTHGTLRNKTVWRKAHRLCGNLGVIAGIVGIILGICAFAFGSIATYLLSAELIFFIIMAVLIPTVYSEVLYKKLGGDET